MFIVAIPKSVSAPEDTLVLERIQICLNFEIHLLKEPNATLIDCPHLTWYFMSLTLS